MSKANRKRKKPEPKIPHPWFPRCVDVDLIPAIRSIGKSGISVVDTIGHGPGKSARIQFGKMPGSLHERRAKNEITPILLMALAAVLANGPKMFVIPPDMIDGLNQIDLTLKVSEFSPPFPVVVVKSRDEFHIVLQVDGKLFCIVETNGIVDGCYFLDGESTLEGNLSKSETVVTVSLSRTERASWTIPENINSEHRFRATLNFLLMVTAGGFVRQKELPASKRKRNRSVQAKYTAPEWFEPQDISLWRNRLVAANSKSGNEEGTGSKKCIHWRRAHWRRVATGEGRTQRELRLIPCCIVNKRLLGNSSDPSDSEYVMS